MRYLLDTHVLIRWLAGVEGAKAHVRAIAGATPEEPLLVAEISLWEIAMLYELGRIKLDLPLSEWLTRASAGPLVRLAGLTPAVASETTQMPANFPRDPADRIIVATARVSGATLLTTDRRIIDSAAVATA